MTKDLAIAGFNYADADDIFKQKVLQPVDQWRIIFKWNNQTAADVEITDFHQKLVKGKALSGIKKYAA